MSAQKTSASRTKPVSAVGAFVGFVGFSALAGLLVTIGVTPAIAVAGVTTTSTIGVFESLPEYIEIGDLPQRNEVLAYSNGQPVHLATVYDQNRQELKFDQISDQLKNAAIDGEDKRFYDHGGVDMTSLVRAGVGSFAGGLGDRVVARPDDAARPQHQDEPGARAPHRRKSSRKPTTTRSSRPSRASSKR